MNANFKYYIQNMRKYYIILYYYNIYYNIYYKFTCYIIFLFKQILNEI